MFTGKWECPFAEDCRQETVMKSPELWLSYAFNPSFGRYIAIASSKHPDLGDDEIDVLAHSF